MSQRVVRTLVVVLLGLALTNCATEPPTKSALPRHYLTESELVGRTLYRSDSPAWELTLYPDGKADFKRSATGEQYPDATWSIDDGDLIVRWTKRTRLRLYGPADDGSYDYVNPIYPGRVYRLQLR